MHKRWVTSTIVGFLLAAVAVLLLGLHSFEKYQMGKVDFLVWSAANEAETPFSSAAILPYLRGMGSNVAAVQDGRYFTIEYSGWFVSKRWQVTARQ